MTDALSHRERIEAIIQGKTPDRPAISLWRHFYHRESTPQGLAGAMLEFQKKYDWDFMKINPRASYHVEDWGNRLAWSTDEFQKHRKIKFAVNKIEDWDKIEPLNPSAPVLAEHLKAVSLIKEGSDRELPLLMTVFSPISIAGDLVPDGKMLMKSLTDEPNRLTEALENITTTFENYVVELRNAGADGIFFATTEWASEDMMTYEQYAKYARPYDLRILKAAGADGLNLLHVCGKNNFLKELADYPVKLFNWEGYDPTNLNLNGGLRLLRGKAIVGGIDHTGWLLHATPSEIKCEMSRLKEQFAGQKLIFGPGCTIEPIVKAENIIAVRKGVV